MKYVFFRAICATVFLASCNQANSVKDSSQESKLVGKTEKIPVKSLPQRQGPSSQFIPIDTANKMLSSYLNSVDYQQNDTDLHSIIFNADQVRKMLADPRISNIKIMFAHSLEYINAGGKGINCGYCSRELTVIVSGYDQAGNYLYNPQNTVLEIGSPCPPNCVTEGTAASDLLPKAGASAK